MPNATSLRHRTATKIIALSIAVALSGCATSSPTVSSADRATPATAGATASIPAPANPEADLARAKSALVTAAELGSGWSSKPNPANITSNASAVKKGFVLACPDLASGHAVLRKDSQDVTATGDLLDRVAPDGQVTQVVVVFPDETDARGVMDAFRDPKAQNCVKSLLGRQPGAAPPEARELAVSDWKAQSIGNDRVGLDMAVTTKQKGVTQSFHVGFMFIRVGRGLSLVTIFTIEPLGASDEAPFEPMVKKLEGALAK